MRKLFGEKFKMRREKTESKEIIPETKIEGFEKMDFRDDDGKEIKMAEALKMMAEIIPGNLHWQNVKKIEYIDEKKELGKEYGIKSLSVGDYEPNEKIIRFNKTNDAGKETIDSIHSLFHILSHEWGHSIDPSITEQQDISMQEKINMIVKFNKIRNKEKNASSYVEKIKNKDLQEEERIKRREDFAESIAFTLECPLHMKKTMPKRYEFCIDLIKQRFPDFDFEKSNKAKTKYINFLKGLNLK